MAGSTADRAKGRVKEAVGDLTDDQSLKTEGKRDQGAARRCAGRRRSSHGRRRWGYSMKNSTV
jgi:hypothetical protein